MRLGLVSLSYMCNLFCTGSVEYNISDFTSVGSPHVKALEDVPQLREGVEGAGGGVL
jgi:hypothetical protein